MIQRVISRKPFTIAVGKIARFCKGVPVVHVHPGQDEVTVDATQDGRTASITFPSDGREAPSFAFTVADLPTVRAWDATHLALETRTVTTTDHATRLLGTGRGETVNIEHGMLNRWHPDPPTTPTNVGHRDLIDTLRMIRGFHSSTRQQSLNVTWFTPDPEEGNLKRTLLMGTDSYGIGMRSIPGRLSDEGFGISWGDTARLISFFGKGPAAGRLLVWRDEDGLIVSKPDGSMTTRVPTWGKWFKWELLFPVKDLVEVMVEPDVLRALEGVSTVETTVGLRLDDDTATVFDDYPISDPPTGYRFFDGKFMLRLLENLDLTMPASFVWNTRRHMTPLLVAQPWSRNLLMPKNI